MMADYQENITWYTVELPWSLITVRTKKNRGGRLPGNRNRGNTVPTDFCTKEIVLSLLGEAHLTMESSWYEACYCFLPRRRR